MTHQLGDSPGRGERSAEGSPLSGNAREASGRTVDGAIEHGLADLGVARSQVDIEILDEGSRGILGLGGRDARVKLTIKPRPARTKPEWAAVAEDIARQVLSLMAIPAKVEAEDGAESIRISLEGVDVGPIIGKHGQTLGALEALLAVMVGRKVGAHVRVELDAEGYRERRQASLEDLARRTAERAARQGREIALTPMGPRDRRIIHVTLQDDPRVSTVSRGEREMRRVVVVPKEEARQRAGRGGEKQQEVFGYEDDAPVEDESSPRESGGPQKDQLGQPPSSGRSRSSRRRPAGDTGRRPPRRGASGAPGRLPQVPRPAVQKGRRPDGLPSDEELEAEIEAYLARTRPGGLRPQPDTPESEGGSENPDGDDPKQEE